MWKLKIAVCLFAAFAVANTTEEEWLDYEFDESSNNLNPTSYMVIIFKNGRPVCSGALIGETKKSSIVATAAHCVSGSSSSMLQVQLGSAVLNQSALVSDIIIHPYYIPPSLDYDVALLKTKNLTRLSSSEFDIISSESDIETTETIPPPTSNQLELSSVQPLSKDNVIINGWDMKGIYLSHGVNNDIKTFPSPLISRDRFQMTWENQARQVETVICFSHPTFGWLRAWFFLSDA